MAKQSDGRDYPQAPTSDLLVTDHVVVSRMNRPPRDPESGRHRRVVVFTAGDIKYGELIGLLRDAASRLESSLPRFEA